MSGLHASYWITRFGEAGIVVPIALALALWLILATRSLQPARSWLLPLSIAVAVTTASKIAFIGWGVGIAALDFTGFSGHAMFAAAVYPMLAAVLIAREPQPKARRERVLALVAAYAFAALVAASRVRLGAHSASEAVAGYVLGALASASALWLAEQRRARLPAAWLGVALFAWLAVMPVQASPSRTHGMVTRLALELSGRSVPFVRADLHTRAADAR